MQRNIWKWGLILVLVAMPCVETAQAAYSQDDLRALELLMTVLLNADRLRHDLPMLEYSFDVADVARGHSADMSANDFFAHESPITGSSSDRIKKARIPALGSAENLAINSDIMSAQIALMDSPGHRKNILSPDYSHVGIGIVENAKGQLVVTQNFIKRVAEMDPAAAPDTILLMINFMRDEMDIEPLVMRPTLAKAAREHSARINKAGKMLPADKVEIKATDRRRYGVMNYAAIGAAKLEDPLEIKSCLDKRYREVGIGAVINTGKAHPPGVLWVTIILGGR